MPEVHERMKPGTGYVDERIRSEARDTFARLMAVSPEDVPESLMDMWWGVQHMANRLQPGPMEVRPMAMLVLLDQFVNDRQATKDEQKAAKKAVKTGTAF